MNSLQISDNFEEFLNELDKLDVDIRENTFIDFANLKYLAFQGLYVIYKGAFTGLL